MYPVGDEVADTLKGMLLCVNFLQPLAFESGIYVESHRLLEHSMLEEGWDTSPLSFLFVQQLRRLQSHHRGRYLRSGL